MRKSKPRKANKIALDRIKILNPGLYKNIVYQKEYQFRYKLLLANQKPVPVCTEVANIYEPLLFLLSQ